MTDMIDLQQTYVSDHIADLEREAAALRAERERDHQRKHDASRTNSFDHAAHVPSRRVRVGRWLVTVGEALAGSNGDDHSRDGGADGLAPAA